MNTNISYRRTNGQSVIKGEVALPGSKSISNRVLIIKALCKDSFLIKNLSKANDTVVLNNILNHLDSNVNVEDAGTVMRFLTAFLSVQDGEWEVSGTGRMHKRPIEDLVDALNELGADIQYLGNYGFPPLKINGKTLGGKKISINANKSSQFVSAVLLIAPYLKGGLTLDLGQEIVSKPYIDMTINLMQYFGINIIVQDNSIQVEEGQYMAKDIFIESDWSAASYFYSIAAFADEAEIILGGLDKESIQGDAVIQEIMTQLGVATKFLDNHKILLIKSKLKVINEHIDFLDCPDLAQTLVVIYAGLGISGKFSGLKTLKIKETDRVGALKNELKKIGVDVNILNDDTIVINESSIETNEHILFQTYKDHRMAMAFAPLAILLSNISLDDKSVVKKSFPDYFTALKHLGFEITTQN